MNVQIYRLEFPVMLDGTLTRLGPFQARVWDRSLDGPSMRYLNEIGGLLEPADDGIVWRHGWLSGVVNEFQLLEWCNIRSWEVAQEIGLELGHYTVPEEYVAVGGTQAIFDGTKATRVGTIDFYDLVDVLSETELPACCQY